ncbi:hypothetical protein BLNAU_733 [Blattamonas nauphoetae]|uniref:Uncharacterized protein n=1 Tax=Blattamonas nauphoetae TaxID=2049346 RepID=A0ABQ9YKC0_9EUKA|nr:hypothetical protein BLNAU_733 [Blattamonas nauphoetae]
MHKEDTTTQRSHHISDLSQLKDGECVLLGDFKENLSIPFWKVEVGENFSAQNPSSLRFVRGPLSEYRHD